MSHETLEYLITKEVEELNSKYDGLTNIIGMLNPETIINSASLHGIATSIQAFSIMFFTLFFMLEFFKKTCDFGWIKLENVALFIMKSAIAWSVISKSVELMSALFAAFSQLATTTGKGNLVGGFVPYNGGNIIEAFLTRDIPAETGTGFLSKLAELGNAVERLGLYYSQLPMFLLTKLVILGAGLVIVGVYFEIVIYMVAAPLPLVTFGSETTSDVGKGFIKRFIGAVLQLFVIMVVFHVYAALRGDHDDVLTAVVGNGTTLKMLFYTALLAIGVFKSGAWAKGLAGAV